MAPQLDVCERKKDIQIKAELPGMNEKDIQLTVEEGQLVLRGEKTTNTVKKTEGFTVSSAPTVFSSA